MLSLFVFGNGLLVHLSIFSMIYVANKLCPVSVHCTLLLLCIIDDVLETVFVFIMQLCYMCISVKCQPVNRMMLKIIQINSFLFLLIRSSPIS